jgi:hypothetical protein
MEIVGLGALVALGIAVGALLWLRGVAGRVT